jgi:hypothetical protein
VPAIAPVSQQVREAFTREFLPATENATYLLASARYFEARYAVMRNVDNFAVAEDFSLGPAALARVRWAEPTLRNTRRYPSSRCQPASRSSSRTISSASEAPRPFDSIQTALS